MLAGVLPKYASAGGGYEVLWSHSSKYDVWKVDASGSFVSSIKAKLWEDEEKFGVDINGDGDTGLVTVEANGMCISNMATTHTMAPHNTTSLTAARCPYWFNKRRPKGFNILCWLECYPSMSKRGRRL